MLETKKIGIFPGSFDPITNGHIDLIKRASKLFDEIIVLVAVNTSKKSWFSPEERIKLAKEAIGEIPGVTIDLLEDGLIANYYKEKEATAIVRGLRNSTDFDYEYGIDSVNKKQFESLETVVLFASDHYRYLSSSLIKEIAFFDGDISDMVPKNVNEAMKKKKVEIRKN